ncbi:hypothetical protein Ae201684P_004085 [Aphanomyces euteiches]|nr:hypothetical protein Ae201684P_004085 [Aphanomyces euteiches]
MANPHRLDFVSCNLKRFTSQHEPAMFSSAFAMLLRGCSRQIRCALVAFPIVVLASKLSCVERLLRL